MKYRAFGVNFIQHKSTSKLSGFAQNNSIKVMAAGNTHSLPGLDLRTGSSRNEYKYCNEYYIKKKKRGFISK